jgi:nucleoside triphosphate diphosphatase
MIEETQEIIAKIRKNCPCDIDRSIPEILSNLKEEIKEIQEAIDNQDRKNLQEEIGDTLFNILFLAHVADEKYSIQFEDIIKGINYKMTFRHPHVFEDPRKVTKEEAHKIWKERKALQKSQIKKQQSKS